MYVISTLKGITNLKRYAISEKGSVLLEKSFPLKGFLVEKMVKMEGFLSDGCEVCIRNILISPDHTLLACSYFLSQPNKIQHDEIRIYDLRTGEITHEIVNPNADRSFFWCKWKDSVTLQYNEDYLDPKKVESVDVGEYSLTTHLRTHIRTKRMSNGYYPEPDYYYLRSLKLADDLNKLGFQPADFTSISFSGLSFGIYGDDSFTAISNDDSFAVVRVSPGFTTKQFVIISGGKVRAKFTLPKNTDVNRLKFVDKFILIAIVENKQHSVQIYDRDSGKLLSSVPGDIIVD